MIVRASAQESNPVSETASERDSVCVYVCARVVVSEREVASERDSGSECCRVHSDEEGESTVRRVQ